MLLFRGEEATQARGGHNPFLDAAELQKWPSWTQLLHVQPSGRAIEVVLVFLGQMKEGGDLCRLFTLS